MFTNPFTPEFKKAKKSLFKKEVSVRVERKISVDMAKKIETATPPSIYETEYKIKREQAKFLVDLEDQLAEDLLRAYDDKKECREKAQAALESILINKERCEINEAGDIIELRLMSLGLSLLPDSVANLKKIKILSCWGNRLSELPEALCDLNELTTLDLERNLLSKLPKNFAKLKNLEFLSIPENPFTEFPEVVMDLHKLERFQFFNVNFELTKEQKAQIKKRFREVTL